MKKTYSTKPELIEQCIVPILGDFAQDFDLDAVFDQVAEWDGHGYVSKLDDMDADELNGILEKADRSQRQYIADLGSEQDERGSHAED